MTGDARERVDRGAQDLFDLERAADGLRDGVENLEVRLDVGSAALTGDAGQPATGSDRRAASSAASTSARSAAGRSPNSAARSRSIAIDRKSTRLNSSHIQKSRMPSSA